MEMPKVTEAHKRLDAFAGNWTGHEKLSPSPWDPKGGVAIGRCKNRLVADGFAVVQDYEQERDGVVGFRGHGVFSFSARENCYLLHWWDSMGMGGSVFKGNFEGSKLQLTCPLPQGQSRGTWEIVGGTHYHFLMEVSPDGKNWATMIDGNYARTD